MTPSPSPWPRFFGYGSLMNTATHSYPDPQPAMLTGWRRVWRGTTLRRVAYLSVEPCPGSEIQGLTAQVPHGDWAALDQREAAYTRHDVSHQINAARPTCVYQVCPDHLTGPDAAHPILLSYIDVVVQGYLHRFGPDGVAAFFASTHGWRAPIQNDRAAPVYPRAQRLSAAETALVDAHLGRIGARPAFTLP